MSRYREPAPEPDPRLDRYRRGTARLFDGERLAGRLTTRVGLWWATEGPWWRRRDVRPQELVEWSVEFDPAFDLAHPDGWDDGIDAGVSDLDGNRFRYRGRDLRVEWLDGREAEDQLTRGGWHGGDQG